MVLHEKEICQYLGIPAIPKKKWDGKSSFENGVAITELTNGQLAYSVATFDNEHDDEPRIKKVFAMAMFKNVVDIFIVPSYMETNVEEMDLDEESIESARLLVEEANEKIDNETLIVDEPKNEYLFDNIHNDAEAIAYIKAYNKSNSKRRKVPRTHENIIMTLNVIYNETNKK